MSSFKEQAPLENLRNLLTRFLDHEKKQGKTPVFSAFMNDGSRPQIQDCIDCLNSDKEKPMQTLNRIFAGQFHFGPFTGPDGTKYPDRISVCGGSDTTGSSIVLLRIDNPVSSPRPCRYGVDCFTKECPFKHPPREGIQESESAMNKEKLDRTRILGWIKEGTFFPRIRCKYGDECQFKKGHCTFLH